MEIKERNINTVFQRGVMIMKALAEKSENIRNSRNGVVCKAPGVVTTIYEQPTERVLFSPLRDANPFFHLMESLWMIAGRNDVEWLVQFNKNMTSFTDDGETYHGAYGYRWRKQFGYDQIAEVIRLLKKNPDDRRVMLGIWDPTKDLGNDSKDIPCNLMVNFAIEKGRLDIKVFNRSNDMIWGAYGANVVQFSFLQEYVAAMVGVPVGEYYQISCNFHVYMEIFDKYREMEGISDADEYLMHNITPFPLVKDPASFDAELDYWFRQPSYYDIAFYRNSFFPAVAVPLFIAWHYYKSNDFAKAFEWIGKCSAQDWKIACKQWMERRKEKRDAK